MCLPCATCFLLAHCHDSVDWGEKEKRVDLKFTNSLLIHLPLVVCLGVGVRSLLFFRSDFGTWTKRRVEIEKWIWLFLADANYTFRSFFHSHSISDGLRWSDGLGLQSGQHVGEWWLSCRQMGFTQPIALFTIASSTWQLYWSGPRPCR